MHYMQCISIDIKFLISIYLYITTRRKIVHLVHIQSWIEFDWCISSAFLVIIVHFNLKTYEKTKI